MSNKQDYIDKLEAQVNVWRMQISQLEDRAERAKADVKHEYLLKVNELGDRVDDFERKIGEMKQIGEESFSELQRGAEKAWNNISSSFSNALEKIK